MKVAIVTGANRGIGLSIVRSLVDQFEGHVFLTSRSEAQGRIEAEKIQAEGQSKAECHYLPLDLHNLKSIEAVRDFMVNSYGGIDILINNAGMAFKVKAPDPFGVQARVTVDNNYYGTKRVCDILFPILRPGARVVNLSSSLGHLSKINGQEPHSQALRERFAKSGTEMSTNELDVLMEDFVASAERGDHVKNGWPNSAYRVSKVGVSALSRIQSRQLRDRDASIVVNHVHPGYVKTGLTSFRGKMSTEEGAQSAVYAALLPTDTIINGRYIWKDCTDLDWVDGKPPKGE